MKDLKGLRVVVAGAGAVGSATALALARRGARVWLADPAAEGDNASGVAAGMLAPLSEALLDACSSDHYPLFKAALQAWPGFLEGVAHAPALDTSGALIEAPSAPAMKIWLGRAEALGAALAPVTQAQAQRLAPGLAAPGPFLFTPEDGRLEPADMLAALHRALAGQGGERLSQAALGLADGQVSLAGSTPLQADALVMATGAGPGLTPIKGQILRFRGFGPITGPVVRGQGVYAAPSPHGLIVGATMEEGLSDRTIDPDAVAQLRAGAARLFPQVAQAPALAAAAVRAATSDGLPLVGPSGPPGLILAQGARRNGWLLAPLIAEVVCDRLAQRAPSVAARAFDPRRFASS